MNLKKLISLYKNDFKTKSIIEYLKNNNKKRIQLQGLAGSSSSILAISIFEQLPSLYIFLLSDKEQAAYFYNDLENIFNEKSLSYNEKKILFYPNSYKRSYEFEAVNNTNILLRTEVLKRINSSNKIIVVTYPEALSEKVITKKYLKKNTLVLKVKEKVTIDFITDLLLEYKFECVNLVVEPGQFSIRGGIVDVFSFANEYPFRIEFYGDYIESLRTFDPGSQLFVDKLSSITIIPNINDIEISETRESFLSFVRRNSILWIDDFIFIADRINQNFEKAEKYYSGSDNKDEHLSFNELFITAKDFKKDILNFSIVEFGNHFYFDKDIVFNYNITPQPSFSKNFKLLIQNLKDNSEKGISNIIVSDNAKQLKRIRAIIDDIEPDNNFDRDNIFYSTINLSIHEGFIDEDLKIACYTDHQIFNRYHKFHLKDGFSIKQAITLKDFYDLKPGDYVTHIDYGIGRFDGLEKITNNGKQQEALRLVYKNNDLLYVSIHSLHRISKYVSKEGKVPMLNRLGTNTWNRLKNKTKKRVKDIAKDLIKLYAERKSNKGFSFSPDTYMQDELEASFIYEDTPDQLKATVNVKNDMEANYPMDRLICGDVGFGKTEVAIRAAFKAVADSKQVAILVPTTILALQHYNTFKERLKDFPCNIDYINRFKSSKKQKQILIDLTNGKLDIIIGTHRLIGKDIKFKDLGLLIIDEEQKFGVSAKEKLKQLKVNVDTLTLTATPIPRTLQFSLMGARDLSIINTPPPNRYPIQTEIHTFNKDIIRDAINYEVARQGQVFFVNPRVQNILSVVEMIHRICPYVKIAIAHGQMEGAKLEKTMLDFINGDYDVLVSTTIIESGLDIPNVNTIIINDAQNYGLSDLHQLRGRVGRMNKKAFCYLLAPPLSSLTYDARKRLKAIEEFSYLGSGFNIAMRDLDIRGAGNILGAEQSGFISDIGFEMYHKILDEAVMELKENEFKELYNEKTPKDFIKDCKIDTDLEILIPDDYVSDITERLSLYRELDNIENKENLIKFQNNLIDRFGPIPEQTQELINAIRLRWIAKKNGLEKIILKQNKFIGYFIYNKKSPYYQSDNFLRILNFVKNNPDNCMMKEKEDKLSITFYDVKNIDDAIKILSQLSLKA